MVLKHNDHLVSFLENECLHLQYVFNIISIFYLEKLGVFLYITV